ncbi:hypothetical protein DFH07DRAFT_837975 [Mycena maculata]|uniref:NADH dehydrogenase [ubiquinone] 1 alpha subcomplex subunit n=1 Tax=Mycena maculata TaxID=230809 RepID=A0AAD7IEQ2_9AGAR|nr:hypothetical protein DFH07DRAFT_837975 [Mycena maculata]
MSFFRRIVQSLRRPNYFVGRDLEGNRYYERPSVLEDPRPKRSVKYRDSENVWKYIGGNRRLAVQWSAWLTHTRPDPPTFEELQADLVRQERVRRNVALLEARDREEDRLRLAAQSAVMSPPPATPLVDTSPPPPEPAAVEPEKPKPKPLPAMPSSTKSDEPESWSPQIAPRGQ